MADKVSLDIRDQILGANNNNNQFDSANVSSNADGSIIERLEYIQTTVLGSGQQITWSKSEAPVMDEDGGVLYVSLGIVDRDSGNVASGDITAPANATISRSRADGAFTTISSSVATTTATGLVSITYTPDANDWQVGDAYKITLTDVTALNSSGGTEHSGIREWVNIVVEDVDLDASVGRNGDAAAESGSLHSKAGAIIGDVDTLRDTAISTPTANTIEDQLYVGANEQLRKFVAKTGGKEIAATKSISDALGTDGATVTDSAVSVLGAIGANNANNTFDSSSVTSNRDGSVLERTEFLIATAGVNTWQRQATTTFNAVNVGSGAVQNMLNIGAVGGTIGYRIDGAFINVSSMGSNTSVTIAVNIEINGSSVAYDTVVKGSTGVFSIPALLGQIASRAIQITVTGNNAANDGAVSASFETSSAGV